jgi:hypothetical protein
MAEIYLTGAVSDWDEPFAWQDELLENDFAEKHDFVNPYKLNDFDLGDDAVYERPSEVVEPALDAVRESDGMLVNWDDDAFLVGSSIEMWTAYEEGVPIVIWYDGYRDNLSPWLLHMSRGNWEDKEQCLRILLAFCGDEDALH